MVVTSSKRNCMDRVASPNVCWRVVDAFVPFLRWRVSGIPCAFSLCVLASLLVVPLVTVLFSM